MAIWVLLILYIAKVVFYDYMAEREKIAAFCYMVWFLIRSFFYGVAFCPSVFELSF